MPVTVTCSKQMVLTPLLLIVRVIPGWLNSHAPWLVNLKGSDQNTSSRVIPFSQAEGPPVGKSSCPLIGRSLMPSHWLRNSLARAWCGHDGLRI